ncbi:HK97 family phage prohead protease [Gymnodinialimonas ceratoperidinii]|uniref:HK97 family phage prohead protease n=1 Tax=Gymnodinialimonas ceratoperidinii TaxID=2856823 RepID=A0A8F6TTX5_9RHOB|nr:HK97 family phage prohead protease [Gymnodinialimonas ceratoperidinii]QXT38891.1 HK97 family phage prohead protease [Gymnodinialimonas ceratoperidinii]
MNTILPSGLEAKFQRFDSDLTLDDDFAIAGYASLFGARDQGGDLVEKGAYAKSLGAGRKVKMLWQHDPSEPIGIWDEIREDDRGLFVRGRLLKSVARAREAAALTRAGAIDGLSIGYRTVKSHKDEKGARCLSEVELWEVSLVTFPMLPDARLAPHEAKSDVLHELAKVFEDARLNLAARKAR